MSEVLGKCPNCGSDVVGGKYGPYCASKCGFTAGKAFGRDLTEAEVEKLLAGEEVLLKGLISNKNGVEHKYDMYVKKTGVEAYAFKKKDGTDAAGYRLKFDTRFPEKEENAESAEVVGTCPVCKNDVILGKYGAFCKAKCGFTLNKAYGKELTKEEIKDILNGKEVLLKGLIHKDDEDNEKKYDMYVTGKDAEEYEYTKKDGSEGKGYRMKFETRFPENTKQIIKEDSVEETAEPAAEPEITESDVMDPDFEDELPFN